MKKVKMLLVSLLTVVICLFCLVGCGTAGTYKFAKLETTVLGTLEVGEKFMGEELTEDYMVLTLNSDNTFSLSSDDEDNVGTWTEKAGKVTLSVEGKALTTATLNGNDLTFELFGQKITLKK